MSKLASNNDCKTVANADTSHIGTLNEHTLHQYLKNHFEPNEAYHEIPCMGFIADILKDGEITEIESCSFSNVRKKIPAFLTEYSLKVIYPMAIMRWVAYKNPDDNTLSNKKKSTKPAKYVDIFRELYKIRDYLLSDNFSVVIAEMEILEIKIKGRRIRKLDRVPLSFLGTHELKCANDYKNLAAYPMGEFTAADFGKLNRMRKGDVWFALSTLLAIGVIEKVGTKNNRAFIFKVK